MYEHLIETFNAIIHFKIFYCDEFRFNVAIFSSDFKIFFEIFQIIINAKLNTFVVFVFILIKKILEKDENFLINFVHEIINMWTFNLIVQLSTNITNVVILVRKKFHDVDMNKIYLLTIKNNIIIIIFKSFDIASA